MSGTKFMSKARYAHLHRPRMASCLVHCCPCHSCNSVAGGPMPQPSHSPAHAVAYSTRCAKYILNCLA